MPEIKTGDKIVFAKRKANEGIEDVTFGKVYTVEGTSDFGMYFMDDVRERNYAADKTSRFKPTKIVK